MAEATRQPWNSEVAVSHRFETAGKYFLRVEDRDYTGSGNHFYYIHAGVIPYITDVYPLGITSLDKGPAAGDQVAVLKVRGTNLPADAKLIPVAGTGTKSVPLETPAGKTLNAARYESSAFPEFAGAEPNDSSGQGARHLPVPGAISGRITAGGTSPGRRLLLPARPDVDYVSFDARQGERLTIEVFARRLGSPLDSVIDIFDAAGKPVPRYTRAVAETYYGRGGDHDSRSKGIRLQHWEDVQPNDFMMLGDEILKVQILPLGPDEDVKFFDNANVRLGYLGTTPEAHAINSAAYKVEVHPPGATFPPNGMPVVRAILPQ